MQIALLTQQLSQLRTEMAEAQKRENQQKTMYEKVLNAIYEELQGNCSESQMKQSLVTLFKFKWLNTVFLFLKLS